MDEELRTGLGLTGIVCCVGYLIGGLPALLPSICLCGLLWIWELRSWNKCKVCERRFKASSRLTNWQYKTIGLCPECIESIFKYSQQESQQEGD